MSQTLRTALETSCTLRVEAKRALEGGGGVVDLHALVHAERGDQAPEPGEGVQVLDWRLIGLMA